MSNNLADLRRKIDSAATLKSVVRTMKAVAASSIGQYEDAVRSLADYERSVQLGLGVCLRQCTPIATSAAKAGPIGAIVFGSDQGLVGSFNEVIAAFVQKSLAALPGEKKIWAVGERVCARLKYAGLPLIGTFNVPSSVAAITSLVEQLQAASEAPAKDGIATIYVFHARPLSGTLYEPVMQRLLPLDAQWQKDRAQIRWPTKTLPEVFGNGHGDATLRALVHEYLFILLFKACADSLASENASRLAAMQRAEKNIDASLDKLNQRFYRLRQSSIDEELFDIIAGFNALSGSKERQEAVDERHNIGH